MSPHWTKTNNGYSAFEAVSALQKSIRRANEIRALFWAFEMALSGHIGWLRNRLMVIASEDVGLADPNAAILVGALMANHATVSKSAKDPKNLNIIAHAVLYLCRAPKNRTADNAAYLIETKVKEGMRLEFEPHELDGHTTTGKMKLRKLSKETGRSVSELWNAEFYLDAALLRNKIEVEGEVDWEGECVRYFCTEQEFEKWVGHRGRLIEEDQSGSDRDS